MKKLASFSAVPEQSTTALMGLLGLILFLGSRRRRQTPLAKKAGRVVVRNAETSPSPAIPWARCLPVLGFIGASLAVSIASAQTTNWLGGTGNWFDVSN